MQPEIKANNNNNNKKDICDNNAVQQMACENVFCGLAMRDWGSD